MDLNLYIGNIYLVFYKAKFYDHFRLLCFFFFLVLGGIHNLREGKDHLQCLFVPVVWRYLPIIHPMRVVFFLLTLASSLPSCVLECSLLFLKILKCSSFLGKKTMVFWEKSYLKITWQICDQTDLISFSTRLWKCKS